VGPADGRELTLPDFPVHWPVTTRWADNDMFGHLNNAVYYELFDTAINGWLAATTGVDPVTSTTPSQAVGTSPSCSSPTGWSSG
jgi:acyl-CoA thioester hydrolase